MVIWKYPLETVTRQTLLMPEIHKMLCVQVQDETPCLWVLVDSDAAKVLVEIRVFGTGHPGVSELLDYLGSYQLDGGALVFHVFKA